MIELNLYPGETAALRRLAESYGLTFYMPGNNPAYLIGDDFVITVSVDLNGPEIWYYDVINGSEVKSYALGFLLFLKRHPERIPDVRYPDNRDKVRYLLQQLIAITAQCGSDVLKGHREWFSEYTWDVSDAKGILRTHILTAIGKWCQCLHFAFQMNKTALALSNYCSP